jgi:hypothetical protein
MKFGKGRLEYGLGASPFSSPSPLRAPEKEKLEVKNENLLNSAVKKILCNLKSLSTIAPLKTERKQYSTYNIKNVLWSEHPYFGWT